MPTLDLAQQIGPLTVTLVYIALYYGFQIHQMRVKFRLEAAYKARGEKFDRYFGQDREMLAADRIQLNMLEHMPPFLALLWLNAIYVSPTSATIAGAVYTAARLAYPFLMGGRLGRSIRAQILVATGTGYLVLAYFLGALVWAMVQA